MPTSSTTRSGQITEADAREIDRISEKRSVRKVTRAVRQDLDRDTLSVMISAYLVLKANGHSDSEFVKYLTRKETRRALKIGFNAAKAALPSLLTDGEFRSLIMNARREIRRQREEREEEQRKAQQEVTEQAASGNVAKIGPVTVTYEPSSSKEGTPQAPNPEQ